MTLTKEQVKRILWDEIKCPVVMTQAGLARKLKIGATRIGNAHARGVLRAIDRHTYEIDDVVDWLLREPGVLASTLEKVQEEGDGNEG